MAKEARLKPSTLFGDYNIASAPLYYVRSGFVNISTGKFVYAGWGGSWWSSRGIASGSARNLYFDSSTTDPSSNYYRYGGFPLRCLSTV